MVSRQCLSKKLCSDLLFINKLSNVTVVQTIYRVQIIILPPHLVISIKRISQTSKFPIHSLSNIVVGLIIPFTTQMSRSLQLFLDTILSTDHNGELVS